MASHPTHPLDPANAATGAATTLTFAALEARIAALPDGPSAVLATPRAIRVANVLCLVAMVVGLTPYLLAQWSEPRLWMVSVAKYGTLAALLLMLPGFLHGLRVAIPEFWNWKARLVAQSDHDLAQFRALRQ